MRLETPMRATVAVSSIVWSCTSSRASALRCMRLLVFVWLPSTQCEGLLCLAMKVSAALISVLKAVVVWAVALL